jgi:hypothetical protein
MNTEDFDVAIKLLEKFKKDLERLAPPSSKAFEILIQQTKEAIANFRKEIEQIKKAEKENNDRR